MEERSDSLRDGQIEYLPSNFSFAIYQTPLSSPCPKRKRPSPPPFPYFDSNSPTFGIATPPLSMEGLTCTVASMVYFTTESLSPTQTYGMVTTQRTQDSDASVNVNPTISSARAMVSTMLGTPLRFNRTSTPFTIGVSHSSNVGSSYSLTIVDPSIASTSVPHATPFPGTFSMWSTPQVGIAPLQQNNPILNQQSNA